MRTHKHLALATILLSLLLLPASAPAESSGQRPTPVPSEAEAPSPEIAWHGSLALEAAVPAAERSSAPAADREEEPPGLVDAVRRAVRLAQAVLQSFASLLALASRYLF